MGTANTKRKAFGNKYIPPCNSQYCFCNQNKTDTLQRSFLFNGVPPEKICDIVKKVHHQVKTYQKGELIASNGDPCNTLKIIIEGSVIGEVMDFQGKSLRIEKLGVAETIASAFIFGESNTYPVDVIAEEPTKLLVIPRADLMGLFYENQRVLKNYLDIISNRTQHLTKKIKLLGLQSIRGKIAHYLLEQVQQEGSHSLLIKHSQSALANMFGVSRPSLARVIRNLHDEKVIDAVGKHITILDKVALSGFLK